MRRHRMRDFPTVAIAVGGESTCEAVRVFEDQTVAADFEFGHVDLARDALRKLEEWPTLGSKRTLVLLCTQRADHETPSVVAAFVAARPHAEILVHAHAARWSGQSAMKCLLAKARDYFVAGVHDRIVARQIGLAITERPAYGSYTGTITRGKVFGAMPFTTLKHERDWTFGIVPAMEALDMQPYRSTDELTMSPVPTLVQRQIEASALVIANVSRYGGGANANVSQEIGLAQGRRPCLLVQQHDEKKIDTNLRGLQLLRYHDCADLAVQLYVGLRACIRDPDSPCAT
jgi:hypothetical protein